MADEIPVRNPRNGEIDFSIPLTAAADITALADSLRNAQRDWSAAGVEARIAELRAFSEALDARRDDIVTALAADTGRHVLALGELDGLRRGIERWCAQVPTLLETAEVPSAAMPAVGLRRQLDPYPLVGVISPWNFPLLLSFIDAVPALLAGCAVIIKPSEVTPRFAAPVGEAIAAVPGLQRVLRFISGDGRAGAALVPAVDVVAFTGSVATGRKVAAAAAEAFVPAFLELGGKDPAVVLPGADLERAATAILRASVSGTGQACQSLERIYVHESDYDAFVARLSELAAAVPLSWPDPHSGIIGPLIFARQADIIGAHLDDAVAKGAVVHTGGEILDHGGGKWVAPTVLGKVDHSMAIMRDETFGPVMPVMAYATEDEAVTLANDTHYGLSAAVFGPTEDDALRVASQINAGGISVNDAGMTTMIFEACKNAYRNSGIGPSRMGPTGLTRFLREKALYINRGDVLPIEAMQERPDE